jgi:putative phosphoribosyl transferase
MTTKERQREKERNILVLGIPRGGVTVAEVVSKKLSCEFDMVIPRKLGAPYNKELAIGAVIEDGTTYLNHDIITQLEISQEYIEKEKSEQIEEIKRRKALYHGTSISNDKKEESEKKQDAIDNKNKIKGRTVILVDDGIATGATTIAAARWIKIYEPKYLIIAAPIATKEISDFLKKEADEVEIITTPPSSKFKSVAQFYQDFKPVEDKEVMKILQKRSPINQR